MSPLVDVTEQKRLNDAREAHIPWKKWGPYLSERQWGTVREDYSDDGNAWGGAHREPHAVDPRRRVAHQIDAGVLGVGRLRDRSHVAEDLAERARVERDHLGLGIEPY